MTNPKGLTLDAVRVKLRELAAMETDPLVKQVLLALSKAKRSKIDSPRRYPNRKRRHGGKIPPDRKRN